MLLERDEVWGTEREESGGEKHQLVASCACPSWGPNNQGMYPNWGSNLEPVGFQDCALTGWATLSRQGFFCFVLFCFVLFLKQDCNFWKLWFLEPFYTYLFTAVVLWWEVLAMQSPRHLTLASWAHIFCLCMSDKRTLIFWWLYLQNVVFILSSIYGIPWFYSICLSFLSIVHLLFETQSFLAAKLIHVGFFKFSILFQLFYFVLRACLCYN